MRTVVVTFRIVNQASKLEHFWRLTDSIAGILAACVPSSIPSPESRLSLP